VFTEAFPILTGPGLPRALGFYRDLLDATVEYQFPPDGDPVYVALRLGGSHLGLGHDPGCAPAAYGSPPSPRTSPGVSGWRGCSTRTATRSSSASAEAELLHRYGVGRVDCPGSSSTAQVSVRRGSDAGHPAKVRRCQ
jgi:hypothetical protein